MEPRQKDQARLPQRGLGVTGAVDKNLGTTPVRDGFAFDEAALAAWMQANVEGFAGPMSVEQFKGGQSNPTYKLVTRRQPMCCAENHPG
jgi:hypothetical protein